MADIDNVSPIFVIMEINSGQEPMKVVGSLRVGAFDDWPGFNMALRCCALQASLLGNNEIQEKLTECAEIIRKIALGVKDGQG